MASAEMWVGGSSPSLRKRERTSFLIFTWLATLATLSFVTLGVIHHRAELHSSVLGILMWVASLALLNMFELSSSSGLRLFPDVPVLVAIAVVFPPAIAGLIAFLGSADRREFVRPNAPNRLLCNRTMTAIEVIIPSVVISYMPEAASDAASLVIRATITLVLFTCTNYVLMAMATRIADGIPATVTMRNLTLGRHRDFAVTWAVWGLMGMLLVAAERVIGPWAAIAFTLPTLLGRQLLLYSSTGVARDRELANKQDAIRELSRRISEERRDERVRVASQLHDEALQQVFQVSLLCDVVRQDSRHGRLLDLDRDVPLLGRAAELAARNLRGVIGRLRNSALGLRGVSDTLRGLISDLELDSDTRLENQIEDVGPLPAPLQLIVYQVAKEAITNAIRHARATKVTAHLTRDSDAVRLIVEDNGMGFDPRSAQHDHFGLLIMRERTESVNGIFLIDSRLGGGTIVAARFPTDLSD